MGEKIDYSNFKDHRGKCGCQVDLEACRVLTKDKVKGAHARKVVEAMCMQDSSNVEDGGEVISSHSLILVERETKWVRDKCDVLIRAKT